MIHYIIVRRDLPFGTTLAMVAHAAAESNNLLGHCTVCVLGVKDLPRLRKIHYKLNTKNVNHIVIRESDMPWNGQPMAIGVVPGERDELAPYFDKLSTYKEFEGDRAELCECGGFKYKCELYGHLNTTEQT